jgi:hypothetical protein
LDSMAEWRIRFDWFEGKQKEIYFIKGDHNSVRALDFVDPLSTFLFKYAVKLWNSDIKEPIILVEKLDKLSTKILFLIHFSFG